MNVNEKKLRYQKFLIISSYASPAISGAPLMMYNLLKHFPEGSFVILTSHFGIDDRVIEKGNWLKAKYFFFDKPFLVPVSQKENSFFQKLKSFLRKFPITNFFGQIFFFFYLPFNIVRRGKKIIQKENIELLLGYSDYGPALFSTYLLYKITKKPFFLYFYDLYYGNKLPLVYRTLAYFLEPKLFESASKIFVISEALKDWYQKKYKREIFIIHNSIPIEKSEPVILMSHPESYKIVFTGTIYWPQIDAIKNLIRAVEELKDINIQLWFYTPHDKTFLNHQGIFESKKVIFAKGLPSEMPEIQRKADILFVPLGFKTKYPLLINTSSPGKTYEYLISGRPILIHAPKGSYLVEYAREHNFALVVEEEDVEKLKEAIKKLIFDKELVSQLVGNAWDTAISNHDAKKNSEFFQSFFIK
ncbi:MAG: glycosyltransferase [bacterium]|nr:glycosyltransferase [bacterium]